MPRKKAHYSPSGSVSKDSDIAPPPRVGRPPKKAKQRLGRQRQVSDDSYSDDGGDANEEFRFKSNTPKTGIYCKKHTTHQQRQQPEYTQIRTLYSQFPVDPILVIATHVLATIAIYLAVFPFVNCIWTFFNNIDDDVATLFHFMSQEPTNERGLFGHVRTMRWMTWPSFTAEFASILIASSIKDTFFLHCERLSDDASLTNLVARHIKKRYGRR